MGNEATEAAISKIKELMEEKEETARHLKRRFGKSIGSEKRRPFYHENYQTCSPITTRKAMGWV